MLYISNYNFSKQSLVVSICITSLIVTLFITISCFFLYDARVVYSADFTHNNQNATSNRVDTFVIQQFNGSSMVISSTTNINDIPAFSSFTFTPFYVDDVDQTTISFSATGGTCNLRTDKRVVCTGGIDSFFISYTATVTPTIIPPRAKVQVGGSTTWALNYNLTTTYPSPLIFIDSSLTPSTHDVGSRRLTWTQANTASFLPEITFFDPRFQNVWLPLIRR